MEWVLPVNEMDVFEISEVVTVSVLVIDVTPGVVAVSRFWAFITVMYYVICLPAHVKKFHFTYYKVKCATLPGYQYFTCVEVNIDADTAVTSCYSW